MGLPFFFYEPFKGLKMRYKITPKDMEYAKDFLDINNISYFEIGTCLLLDVDGDFRSIFYVIGKVLETVSDYDFNITF
mgnify:CR=1 FL=1